MGTNKQWPTVLLLAVPAALACVVAVWVIVTNSSHQERQQSRAPGSVNSLQLTVRPSGTRILPPIPTLPTKNLPTVALTPPPGVPTWKPGEPDTASGMSFTNPSASLRPPVVSERQAIAIANTAPYAVPHAPWITARYVLMTREPAEFYKGLLKQDGLLDEHPDGFRNVPVWIVSYEGVEMPFSSDSATPLPPAKEVNVIVSAENGVILGGYSFR